MTPWIDTKTQLPPAGVTVEIEDERCPRGTTLRRAQCCTDFGPCHAWHVEDDETEGDLSYDLNDIERWRFLV